MVDNNGLHLPDLTIRGFRGIDELSIPRLGRVTLLAGLNGIGKTTVLEAVQGYAARGRYSTLYQLLTRRDEVHVTVDEDGDSVIEPYWIALFHGRESSTDFRITIGPTNNVEHLRIERAILGREQFPLMQSLFDDRFIDDRVESLRVSFRDKSRHIPLNIPAFGRRSSLFAQDNPSNEIVELDTDPAMNCVNLGPGLLSNNNLSRYWDNVALTEDENRAVHALGLIFGSRVDRVAVIGDDRLLRGRRGRRVMVKLNSHHHPVPLKSLGDGALRMFGLALALANSRDGFLLIDEAENGIHHSVQRDYWRMILRSAHENNVQVIATTHSWDCVRGFAQAATENEEAEGRLVRLSRQYGDLRAVEYSEEEMAIAAEQGIEVR